MSTLTVGSGGSVKSASNQTVISSGSNSLSAVSVTNGGILTNSVVSSGGLVSISSGGDASGMTVVSRGHLYISNGGATTGTTVEYPTSEELIFSGGVASGTHVLSGGGQTVYGGGIASNTTLIGGNEFVFSGGQTSGLHASSGGTEYIGNGAIDRNTYVYSGGNERIQSGGIASNTTIYNGGSATVQSGALTSNADVKVGGIDTVLNGGSAYRTVVSSGGREILSSGAVGSAGAVTSGGYIQIDRAATFIGATVDEGAELDFNNIQYDSTVSATLSGNTMKVVSAGSVVYQTTLAGNYNGLSFTKHGDSTTKGSDFILTCFLPGAMIQTPTGPQRVETLAFGDLVTTCVNGEHVAETITWVGEASVTARPDRPDEDAGYPVLLRKDALDTNIPDADLWVTPEHAIALDGRFVPVRMLVNGSTILYDRSKTSYTYHHIETARHSVILANNVTTESYLDTGNRHTFRQPGPVAAIGGREADWSSDAALPLDTSRGFVEPWYRKLVTRAQELGFTAPSPAITHDDAALRLQLDDGTILRPYRQHGSRHIFRLPVATRAVAIVSNTARPDQSIGPFLDDRRTLGVLVGAVTVYDETGSREIADFVTDENLPGWSVVENISARWTLGEGLLQVQLEKDDLLAVEIIAAGPYHDTSSSPVQRNVA